MNENTFEGQYEVLGKRYKILKRIAVGGLAEVFKAQDLVLKRIVALKKILKTYSDDARFVDMFWDEAVHTAILNHRNIVQAYDFLRTDDNTFYIVMEYVDGQNLKEILDRCQETKTTIPLELATYIIAEVARGLAYAHRKKEEATDRPLNIVHRDVTPSNIMLYHEGKVKLTDFGIAKAASARVEGEKGALKGKIPYMSPEQARGKEEEIDARSDVFALGSVMYEVFTGERLFKADTDAATLQKVTAAKVDFSFIEKLGVPKRLKVILSKALQRDSAKRYKDAQEMYNDLELFIAENRFILKEENLQAFMHDLFAKEIKEEKIIEEKIKEEAERPAVQPAPPPKPAPPAPPSVESDIAWAGAPAAPAPPPRRPSVEKAPAAAPAAPTPAPTPKPSLEEEGEKTVFDLMISSAQKYKKIVVGSLIGVMSIFILFLSLDTFFQWTALGTKVYDTIRPPALVIKSFPPEATVFLDGEKIGMVKPTLKVPEISPGNYELRLEKEGFSPIIRTITITGKKGIVETTGERGDVSAEEGSNVVAFSFETDLIIESNPEVATVYLDDRKLSQKTPLRQSVYVGEHDIKLEATGFEVLGGCRINTLDPVAGAEVDRRFWSFQPDEEKGLNIYRIKGEMFKYVTVTSNPPGANVLVDNEVRGRTPMNDLLIKAGEHQLDIKLPGFESYSQRLVVTTAQIPPITSVLKKFVQFFAYPEGTTARGQANDVKAKVYRGGNLIGTTPILQYSLNPGLYTFTFEKPPYQSKEIRFNTQQGNQVVAYLASPPPRMRISVYDEETKKPISKAYVWQNDRYFGRTDGKGISEGPIEGEGHYVIKITKEGYLTATTETDVSRQTLGSDFTWSKDIYLQQASVTGNIVVDPYYYDAEIWLDGQSQGRGLQRLQDVPQGVHNVVARHPQFLADAKATITIESPGQTFVVVIDENGRASLQEK
ncbi:MAG: serine/threonine-protein kinase [bacterium]